MKIKVLALFLALVVSLTLNAQPSGGDPNGGNAPGVPITGIEYLLGAGGLYGIKRMISGRKKK
ncbi:hypothetical protein WSM22_43410 [Cytophagales bacterium WSM2-2]|nr:hypothetical protein WSM22_43410 [Cytophagales bacterium WSM2-2]